MKKLFKIQYIFLALILLLVNACKKDTIEKPDIPKGEDRDIRVLKVQYMGHDFDPNFVIDAPSRIYPRECTYYYNTEGRLSHIENDGILRVQMEYDSEQIKATNAVEQMGSYSSYWDNSNINYQNNRIEKINLAVFSPGFFAMGAFKEQRRMSIRREPDGRLMSVMSEVSPDAPVPSSSYSGLATEVLSYNDNGLPDKLETPLFYWADPDYYTADFAFEYDRAEDIPMKLKRLVNEELLFSNRYGITILDFFLIDDTRNYSQFGEGNWLISFGLPQYYILEDKSAYMVSQRVTDYYQLDSLSGEREFVKTKVEDFLYKHDAKAKTLEIAGLKIWYEFVE